MNLKNFFLAFVTALLVTACHQKNPEEEAANTYMQNANAALQAGDYASALVWMDSVDKRCPNQIDVRLQVTILRAQTMQSATIAQISRVDSLMATSLRDIEALEPLMKHISGDDLEGYYVVADAYKPDFINSTGIEPRVNDANFTFYIVAQNRGREIKISQITLNTETSEFSSQVLPDGTARLQTVEGGELASFLPEEVYDLGAWAAQNPIKGAVINGRSGNVPVKLNDNQASAFGIAWRYANAKLTNRQAHMERERLERQLQIARDHEAEYQSEYDHR